MYTYCTYTPMICRIQSLSFATSQNYDRTINIRLEVDGLGVGGHGGLLESLSQRRVGVAGTGNVLGGRAVLKGQGGLGNHLTGVGSDDVAAQQPVGLGIGKHLDHAVRVEVGLGTRVGAEGEGADLVGDVLVLEFLLVLADPGNLGVGVHDRRNDTVVDVAVALLDVLDGGHGLLLGLVGKHGAKGHVTNASDVRGLGAVLGVNDDTAALVNLETSVLQAQTGSVRAATNGHEDNVGLNGLGLATLGGVNLELDQLAGSISADNLCAKLEVDALLLEQLLGLLGDLAIHAGTTNLVQELNDGDLGAQSRPDGTHLQTNDTTTNDDHLLGDLLEGQGSSAGDDALLVELETGEGGGLATGSNKDVLAPDAGLASLVEVDLDSVLVGEGAGSLDVLDTVLLEEELDTLGEAIDGGLLCLHHVLEIELDITNLDTAVLGVVQDLVVEMRVVEERLGGNTADIEAGTAERTALLDTCDLFVSRVRR